MSEMKRALGAGLATYALTHAGYQLSGFNPIRDLGGPLGWVVDVSLWLGVFVTTYWVLGKLPKPSQGDRG